VVRPNHPLQGHALPVLGWMQRQGSLDLVLILPDGSRSLIPAAWTDLQSAIPPEAPTTATLGTLSDLLRAGRVVAGLAFRLQARPDDGRSSHQEGADVQPAVGAGPGADTGVFLMRGFDSAKSVIEPGIGRPTPSTPRTRTAAKLPSRKRPESGRLVQVGRPVTFTRVQ
jgi:Family of unknown function (DUF5372)